MASMPLLRNLDLSDVFSPPDGTRCGTLLVLGAGASVPSAPVALKLKAGILDGCSKFLGGESVSCPTDDRLTLEVLCSLLRFRLGPQLDLVGLLSSLLKNDVIPESACIQAELMKRRLATYVFTANFDDFLYRACKEADTPFRLVTRMQLEAGLLPESGDGLLPEPGDIFAFHGTLYKPTVNNNMLAYSLPTSVDARGLATPFSTRIEAYIKAVLAKVETLVFWGYSGSDHYDLSPIFDKLLPTANTVHGVYWLSFNGAMEDFSNPVAQRESEPSKRAVFVDCERDVVRPIDDYRSKCYPERENEPRPATPSESPDSVNLTLGFLKANLESSDAIREAIREFLVDVCQARIWLVWLIVEHFHLDSLGLTSAALRNFGAYGSGLFFGLDVGSLSKAIEAYWMLNNMGAEGRKEKFAKLSFGQPSSDTPVYDITLFTEVNGGLTSVLEQAANPTFDAGCELRKIDAALLDMCSVIAEDYRGLILLREYEDGLDWDSSLSPRLKKARQRAKWHFDRSMGFSREAGSRLSGGQEDGVSGLLDLVSPDVWSDIALFNKARATVSDAKAIHDMEEVVARQDQLINRVGSYLRAANLLQVCQRASVLVKRIYGVKGNADAPPSCRHLQSRLQKLAEEALEIAQKRSTEYEDLTGRFEGRLLAVCDAMVVDALARGEKDRAEEILSGFRSKEANRSEDAGKVTGWIANMEKRIQAYMADVSEC